MPKNAMLLVVIVLLIGNQSPDKKTEVIIYQDETFHFSFDYPKKWVLDKTDSAKGYLALYSPDSLSARKKYKTDDLLCGIKIEFLTLPAGAQEEISQSLEGTTLCFSLEKNKKRISQYCKETKSKKSEIPYLLYILTLITDEDYQTLIIAYIPEKTKKEDYRQYYNQIVLSFSFKKSGS